jgi:hypothetical protein
MKFKEGTLPHLIKDRIEYLYRFHELLRLFHNQKAQEYKNGKITLDQFRYFQRGWYEPRSHLIIIEITHCRQIFAKKNISVDISSIEEE